MLYVTVALVSTLALLAPLTRPLAIVGLAVLLFLHPLLTVGLLFAAGAAAFHLQSN